ncbi:MAG: hypothetical protein ACLFRG_02430 [Desulfococcaceae bacterium]
MKHQHGQYAHVAIPPGAYPGGAPHDYYQHVGSGFVASPAGIAPFPHSPLNSLSGVVVASTLAGTFTLGRNLNRVQRGEISAPAAFGRALVTGVCVNIAATAAVGVSSAVPVRQSMKLAIYGGVVAAVSYFLHSAADSMFFAAPSGESESFESSPATG